MPVNVPDMMCHKNPSARAALLHKDRRTVMTRILVAFRFGEPPKNGRRIERIKKSKNGKIHYAREEKG